MQTTCVVLTPRVVWCRARAPAGLAKLSQLLALSPWHFIAHGRSESSSKEQISARAFISEIRAHYRPGHLPRDGAREASVRGLVTERRCEKKNDDSLRHIRF